MPSVVYSKTQQQVKSNQQQGSNISQQASNVNLPSVVFSNTQQQVKPNQQQGSNISQQASNVNLLIPESQKNQSSLSNQHHSTISSQQQPNQTKSMTYVRKNEVSTAIRNATSATCRLDYSNRDPPSASNFSKRSSTSSFDKSWVSPEASASNISQKSMIISEEFEGQQLKIRK